MRLAERVNPWLRRVPVAPLYWIALFPAVIWFGLALANRLGADPVRALEHEYGLRALQFLVAALAVTPLRELTGVSLLRFRRFLGLTAFSYALLHLLVWLVLDRQLDWPRIAEDLARRPYVVLGMAAFVMLVPLAATSTDRALRRLGPGRWRRVHRLAYPATALAALHFVWLVKAWPPEPLLYALAVATLLAWRAAGVLRRRAPRIAAG
ncbi:protein-methionine-sulfoxide reductase heme-binding subunit MsrQ [Amaricoccus sp.]|uniref:protein-methionine-sulfoxide reductase heme-binding subunit MsrQ n=1 Tax=Amaricoccus sp. TaxID=1872485 RepID=UPI001B605B00|nr:protein-methionine-sulfoxide reductase heme-binding subunit MsrQ [Amaricoccus sp.]MBP7241921.1 protein-methionine-sulfoxide reductase heme-binding subunit MsrQ [Amaricoccus sp.]